MSTPINTASSTKVKWVWIGIRGILSLALGNAGVQKLLHSDEMVGNMTHLGYPEYLLTILGIAYLLGIVALWQPWSAALREWAHAGFAIAMLGAFASHLFVGDPAQYFAPSLVFLVLFQVAYILEKKYSPK